MKSKKFVFYILIISTFSFIWGLGIGVYKWFPYFYLLEVKQIFNLDAKKEVSGNISIDNTFIRKYTNSFEEKPLLLKREELKKKVIFNENYLNIINKKIDINSEKITTDIYGNKINAVLTYAPKSKKCLKIYIQGHGGDPFFFPYHNELLEYFVNEGCDFLSMSMIGLGINKGNFSYQADTDMGKFLLIKIKPKNTKIMLYFMIKIIQI